MSEEEKRKQEREERDRKYKEEEEIRSEILRLQLTLARHADLANIENNTPDFKEERKRHSLASIAYYEAVAADAAAGTALKKEILPLIAREVAAFERIAAALEALAGKR